MKKENLNADNITDVKEALKEALKANTSNFYAYANTENGFNEWIITRDTLKFYKVDFSSEFLKMHFVLKEEEFIEYFSISLCDKSLNFAFTRFYNSICNFLIEIENKNYFGAISRSTNKGKRLQRMVHNSGRACTKKAVKSYLIDRR